MSDEPPPDDPAAPLVVEFEVAASAGHAFAVWTERCATWWPTSHTVGGDPWAIVFEPFAGGRILERSRDGATHVWGEVTAWEPPHRLGYRWHLFFDPSEATDVEVTFTPAGVTTTVRLEQSGWERLGPAGQERRRRTRSAWDVLTDRYAAACAAA